MKIIMTLVAAAALVTLGCESTQDATSPNMGAVGEYACPADCEKPCCASEDVDLGAVEEGATCPYSGTSLGAVEDDSSCCPSSNK